MPQGLINSLIILALAYISLDISHKILGMKRFEHRIYIKFLKNILNVIIVLTALALIIGQFRDLSYITTTILAGSGIVAVVLGLAAQESFSNIFSGIMISIFKPFDIGDRISITSSGIVGFVEDITLRHTIIRTYMNVTIIIPNSEVGKATIENSTYTKGASYPLDLTIAYENKEKRYRALEIMEEVVSSHELFFDPRTEEQKALFGKNFMKPATATCTSFGDSGINLRVLVSTEQVIDNNRVCSECRMRILDRFEEEGIEIPYNKLVVMRHLDAETDKD